MLSTTVADGLTHCSDERTTETRLFIRVFDKFFDCLNVTSKLEGILKRKDSRLPYYQANDQRFKVMWLINNFLLQAIYILCSGSRILF